MYDRDEVDSFFDTLRSVSDEAKEKQQKLEKNRKAITDENGNILPKYQKSFARLESEVDRLNKRLSSGEEILLRVVSGYVKENAMGNLYFEHNNDGTQYFEDVYSELFSQNWDPISKAIDAFDLEKIDSIVGKMREAFLAKTYKKYTEYAKTLSINL